MIKFSLTFISLMLSLVCCYGQLSQTVNVEKAGSLSMLLVDNKAKMTDLTLTGTINDQDFETIKQMSLLKNLDMSEVDIENSTIPSNAFASRSMDKLILPKSLKSINSYAFMWATIPKLDFSKCSNLETLAFHAFYGLKLTSINELDFSKNLKLVNFLTSKVNGTFSSFSGHVLLPSNMKDIPPFLFSSFSGSVYLHEGLETIGESSFRSSTLSEELILPRSLKSINSYAFMWATMPKLDFSKCSNLETLAFNAFYDLKLTSINELDFSKSLKLVNFLTSKVNGAFSSFSGHVLLPSNMKDIPPFLFSSFSGSVYLHEGLETIGESSFRSSTLSEELILPRSLKSINSYAFMWATMPKLDFSKCSNLETLAFNAFYDLKLTSINELDFSKSLKLVNFLTSKVNGAFSSFSGHVLLPSNMKDIPPFLFSSFSGSVYLHEGLETIGESSFRSSTLSGELILPRSLKSINSYAFMWATMPKLDFSKCSNLETLAFNAFYDLKLTSINELDFSKSLKLVNFLTSKVNGAFSSFSGHVLLPSNMKDIPPFLFSSFSGSVYLHEGLETIGESSFRSSTLSEELILPRSLKSINSDAFMWATMPKLDFSRCSNLETLGYKAFYDLNLTSINELDFSKNLKLVNFLSTLGWGTFMSYTGYVILPDNLEVIPDYTFASFGGIVDLSFTLKKIGLKAFYNSKIKEISLPRSVTYIDNYAFNGCSELTQIISNNPKPPLLGANVFSGVNIPNCKLTVPDRGLELYATADQWKDFINTMRSVSGLRAIELNLGQEAQTSISIYPNPTTDLINVSGDDVQQVLIYDLTGRQVLKTTQANSISVNSLSNGTYIVKVKTSQGETSHKIIKK